jgi:hypothetical protein
VGSVTLVVLDELLEHGLAVVLVDDQHPIEALALEGAHEVIGEGVGTRGMDRRADDPWEANSGIRRPTYLWGSMEHTGSEATVETQSRYWPIRKGSHDAGTLRG